MTNVDNFEYASDQGIPVQMPSGATFIVLTDTEKKYVTELARRYLEDNHFVNISDFQDIDRMIMFELFIHRWSLWMSRGIDYFGDPIDGKTLAQQANSYATELRQLKRALGIDKATRDRLKGDDSVATYLDSLRQRAKEFGVTRNKQASKAIELFQQLNALVTLHDNCDETERRENHVSQEDVFEWIRAIAIPEFVEIDKEFRETSQKYWIRQQ